MDSPLEESSLIRYERQTKKIKKLNSFPGPVWYIKSLSDNCFLAATTREIGPGVKDNYAHLYFSKNLEKWIEVYKFKNDCFPLRYFKWGVVGFAEGRQSSKEFYLFGEALKLIDGKAFKCSISSKKNDMNTYERISLNKLIMTKKKYVKFLIINKKVINFEESYIYLSLNKDKKIKYSSYIKENDVIAINKEEIKFKHISLRKIITITVLLQLNKNLKKVNSWVEMLCRYVEVFQYDFWERLVNQIGNEKNAILTILYLSQLFLIAYKKEHDYRYLNTSLKIESITMRKIKNIKINIFHQMERNNLTCLINQMVHFHNLSLRDIEKSYI